MGIAHTDAAIWPMPARASEPFRPLRILAPVYYATDHNLEVAIQLAMEWGACLSVLVRQLTPYATAELVPGGETLRAQMLTEAEIRLQDILAAIPMGISVTARADVWTSRVLLKEIAAGGYDTVLLNAQRGRRARRLATRLLRADTGATVLIVPPRV